jgi:hypothetical protein
MRLDPLKCVIKSALIGAVLVGASSFPSFAIPFQLGDVFASVGNGEVDHFRNDGTFVQTLNTTNGGFTTGAAFDASNNLYVTNFSSNRVAVFDSNGTLTNADFAAGLSTPESVVFDTAGNMYVGNLGNGIRKYTAGGVFVGTVINTRVDFFDLTADQSTFRFGQEGSSVLTVSNDIPGTSGAAFAGGLSQAFAMRILPDGGMLVADNANVKRFNAAGVQTQTYDLAGVDAWFALNLAADGTSFWSGSFNDGILRKFDIDSGTHLDTIDTGCGSSCLFGVAILGELTVGGPGPGPNSVPEPSALALFGAGLFGVTAMAAYRRKRYGAV